MIPYTLAELKLVADKHQMDAYHKELMRWAISEIERLLAEKK